MPLILVGGGSQRLPGDVAVRRGNDSGRLRQLPDDFGNHHHESELFDRIFGVARYETKRFSQLGRPLHLAIQVENFRS